MGHRDTNMGLCIWESRVEGSSDYACLSFFRLTWIFFFKCNPADHDLILTEPVCNLPSIQDACDQFIFEDYGFKSYCRVTGADSEVVVMIVVNHS